MARAATTSDAFNAVAEPRRRAILELLAGGGEQGVGDLVERLGTTQPQVSKHLRVLREVGLVRAREDGRRRLYSIDGEALRPMHDWLAGFTHLWEERFEALDAVLEDLKADNDRGDEAR